MNEEEKLSKINEETTKSENEGRFKVINIESYKGIIKDYDEEINRARFNINVSTAYLILLSATVATKFLLPDYAAQDILSDIIRLGGIAGGIVCLRILIDAICTKTHLMGNVDRIFDELELNGVDVDKLNEEIVAEERKARGRK